MAIMDTRKIDVVERFAKSGVQAVALRGELKRRDDHGLPDPTEEEIIAFLEEVEFKNVYGIDAKRDRHGAPIEQGIGAWPDKVTGNHFAAIRRYEGAEAYAAAVRKLWKDNPERAKKLGLPELPRASA